MDIERLVEEVEAVLDLKLREFAAGVRGQDVEVEALVRVEVDEIIQAAERLDELARTVEARL